MPRIKTPGSGRKKGSCNKNKLPLFEKTKELGVDPFTTLLNFVKGDWQALGYESQQTEVATKRGFILVDRVTAEMRLKACIEACHYLYPKLRSIEVIEKIDPAQHRPLEDLSDEELENA